MTHFGLHTYSTSNPSRPKLDRAASSLLELVTGRSIDQISDLNFVAAHLAFRDEGVDDFRYPERSFFAFPQPINAPHSTVRTIRLNMPAAKNKESGVDDKVCGCLRQMKCALQMPETSTHELCDR